MTITYPLDMPSTPGPSMINVRPFDIAAASTSPFTGYQQIHDWSQGFWQMDVDMPRMGRVDGAVWSAFMLALRGIVGTFRMGDPTKVTPRGVATGTPVVDGFVEARAVSLPTRGWTISQVGILLEADHIQIGDHLHAVLADADSDGSGNVSLDIWPPVRETINDGETIIVSSPKGLWRLAEPQRAWQVSAPFEYGFAFSAREVI